VFTVSPWFLLPAQAFVSCAKGQFSRYSVLPRWFSARKAHRPVQAEISSPALFFFSCRPDLGHGLISAAGGRLALRSGIGSATRWASGSISALLSLDSVTGSFCSKLRFFWSRGQDAVPCTQTALPLFFVHFGLRIPPPPKDFAGPELARFFALLLLLVIRPLSNYPKARFSFQYLVRNLFCMCSGHVLQPLV
jgi:hypothetical protein